MTYSKKSSAIRGTTREVESAARALRKEPTPAERRLWEAISERRLEGLRSRRQHPVGRFILDFYCPASKLVVELDGGIHAEQVERDEERTAVLRSAGYRVLCFRNDEVMNELPSILQRIVAESQKP